MLRSLYVGFLRDCFALTPCFLTIIVMILVILFVAFIVFVLVFILFILSDAF